MDTPDPLAPLRSFRDALYACFDRRADALFELADALLVTALTPSPCCEPEGDCLNGEKFECLVTCAIFL